MKKANKIMTTIVGLILLIAVALKVHQLLTQPIISEGFWESWEFFLIQIPLEMGLGIWLLSGLFKKAGWLLATIGFAGFIMATLHKGLIGAESCGCFGAIHVNPWKTLFMIDIPIFLGLLIFRPKGEKLLPPPWPSARHFFGVAVPTFILLPAVVLILILYKPNYEVFVVQIPTPTPIETRDVNALPPEVTPAGEANIVTQRPVREKWDKLQYIDIAEDIETGPVVIYLYHYDCPTCRESIPEFDQWARDFAGNEDAIRFAFIEAPPYGAQDENPVPKDTPALNGKLLNTEEKKWIVETPQVILVIDGSAIRSWQQKTPDLDELLNAIASN